LAPGVVEEWWTNRTLCEVVDAPSMPGTPAEDVALPYADSLADEVLATGTHSRKASSTTMMSVESMPRANS
jgi:hypothetical protein